MNSGFCLLAETARSLPFMHDCDSGRRRDLKASRESGQYSSMRFVPGFVKTEPMELIFQRISGDIEADLKTFALKN